MNRGSEVESLEHVARMAPSMRPRFMNRGSERGIEAHDLGEQHPSMRPRFMNRGSVDLAALVNRIEILQ